MEGPRVPDGPALRPLESVVLREANGRYLARPGGMTVADDGTVYVTDYYQRQIHAFSPRGEPLRTYGRPGAGPGEFQSIGSMVIVRDSVVAAFDSSVRILHFFATGSGRHLGSRRVEALMAYATLHGREAWLGTMDAKGGRAVTVWPFEPDSLLARPAEPIRAHLLPLPAPYAQSEIMLGVFALAHLAVWGDSALVGFAGMPRALLVTRAGAVVDSIQVPAQRRRTTPDDLVRRLHAEEFDTRKVFRMTSALFGLSRAADGSLVFVHFDTDWHEGNRITARVFATRVSADRRRACVDREVPVSDVSQPVVTLRGDTLYVIDQHLRGESDGEARLTKYHVGTEGCTWVPVRRDGGG